MIKLSGNKFRLEPTPDQKQQMYSYAGINRFVWNKALALQNETHEETGKFVPKNEMINKLPLWKEEFPFLREAPSQSLQQTLMHLDRAIWDSFKPELDRGFPVFKKKGRSRPSFTCPQCFKADEGNSRIFIPKTGWIRYRKSKTLSGTAKSITVSERNGKWYISILTEETIEDPVHSMIKEEPVGMDLGVKVFAALSDGKKYSPKDAKRKAEKRLAHLGRELARKEKFSKNWYKAKDRLSKEEEHIANIRRDFLHKLSATLSKNHAIIFAEDLKVANMSKSAKGTKDEPGKNVKAKAGLNKAILDQGWGIFRSQLSYKLSWKGGALLLVPARDTSRTCPECSHTAEENRKSQSVFRCVKCGYAANADVNAAVNIKEKGLLLYAEALESIAAGHAVLACGGNGPIAPVKQEPTKVA